MAVIGEEGAVSGRTTGEAAIGGPGGVRANGVQDGARGRRDALVYATLALLVLVGAYLRLANLGALGFRWDEDLSSLAVRAILDKGVPELPSGMVYLRGGVFLYLMAASASVLGFGELALRLPAALFGIATIPLAFLFGRALFGPRIGLVVAALIAISQWDIEFSRYARMYAPFTFAYVLTLLWLWKYRVESESRAGGALCIASGLLAVSLHQLGYTLVPAFFFPLILRGPSAWRRPSAWAHPLVGAGVLAAFFFVWRDVMDRYRNLPAARSAEAGIALDATQPGVDALPLLEPLPLLAALLERVPLAWAALAAALLGAAALGARRLATPLPDRFALLAVAAAAALQLFNVALLGVLALAFLKREGLPAFRRPDVMLAIALVATAFLAWLALAFGLGLEAERAAGLRGTVRTLLDYPHFFVFWGYPNEWPLSSIAALAGGAWAFDRAARLTPPSRGAVEARQRAAAASRFVLLALGTPLILNGLFDTAFELFRYNVPLNTCYFTLVALALVRWRELIPAWRPSAALPGRAATAAGTAALALLVAGFDLNPLRGWLVTERDYLNDGPLYRMFGLVQYDDFKTPSAFVSAHAGPDDTIIVLEPREIFNYLGRADWWLRTDAFETQTYVQNGEPRDLYIRTPLLTSLDALRGVLDGPGTKWLIVSEDLLGSRVLNEEVSDFIRARDERVVYVGRDGDKKVYRFD